jgi:NitT/TauT family transport system ATP-binding protein
LHKNSVLLKAEKLTKIYPPDIWALDNVDLEVDRGSFVSIIGPSGCGKTTFLKITAGLEGYQEGDLYFDGERIYRNTDWRRSVIYQDVRLFPWMTARENVYFGLENTGLSMDEVKNLGNHWLKTLGAQGFADKYPAELSEGQKQMIAMTRVLALDPTLVLCDEPFSSLDWSTRSTLQEELERYWYEKKKTVIFVTHDIEEAVYLAEKVICMSARPGKIKEIVKVKLPKKRWEVPRNHPMVLKYASRISDILSEELRKGRELEKEEGY